VAKVFSIICVGLGALLIVLAAMLKFYAVPALAKAPLSPGESSGGVSITHQAGVAVKLFDPSTLKERKDVALMVTRYTKGDVAGSQTPDAKSADVAIWDSFSRVEDNKGVIVSASTERYAFNRVTSELVNCCGGNVDGDEVTFSGLSPLKFPMFTQAQDYPYFDSSTKKTINMAYTGPDTIDGLPTYKFVGTVEPTQTGVLQVPGALVGSPDPAYSAPRFYSLRLTLQVEPITGAILLGSAEQLQTLRGPDGTDQVTLIQATITSTPEDVQATVDVVKPQVALLALLNNVVPIAGLVLGVILLAVGILLAIVGRRKAARGPNQVNLAKE
jgi:hypothetical protein